MAPDVVLIAVYEMIVRQPRQKPVVESAEMHA